MGQQNIDTGSSANSNTGDPLRTCFIKAEDNFNELFYSSSLISFPYTGSAQITGSDGVSTVLGVTGSIGVTNDITASIVKVADEIVAGDGSSGTKITFTNDTITFIVDNINYIKFDGSSNNIITVNPDNEDIDFRAEGDSSSNVLYVNAGTNRVGIRTNNPSKDLHVNGDIKARQYFGQIADSDPAVSNQFFQTSSEELGGTSPYYQVVCISQG